MNDIISYVVQSYIRENNGNKYLTDFDLFLRFTDFFFEMLCLLDMIRSIGSCFVLFLHVFSHFENQQLIIDFELSNV